MRIPGKAKYIIFSLILLLLLSGCRKGSTILVHSDEPGFSITESVKEVNDGEKP